MWLLKLDTSASVYDYGMWVVAAFNVGIFLFFVLSFLTPKGWGEWRNMGVVVAFLVALFSEMYGFPLTIFLLTSWLGEAYPVLDPFSHKFGHLWVVLLGGSDFAWALIMALSLALMLLGYLLLSKGWHQVHGAHGQMASDGVYAYARHPQYTGLFLLIVGFLVQWPTLITVLMVPILLVAYVSLAHREEKVMLSRFGPSYEAYAQRTDRFFPPVASWISFFKGAAPKSGNEGSE